MLEKYKDLLPFLLKKVLIPLIIIAPISVIVALLIAEKMVQYANPQVKNVNEQVSKSSNITEEESLKETSEKLDDIEPQKRIKSNIDSDENIFIDPLPYMVDSNWQEYYFPKDGHPTKSGNMKLAQAYYDFLVDQWDIESKIN